MLMWIVWEVGLLLPCRVANERKWKLVVLRKNKLVVYFAAKESELMLVWWW